MNVIQNVDSALVDVVKKASGGFLRTKAGQLFQALPLLGPLTFVPLVYVAWSAESIDALRTGMWLPQIVINIAIFVSQCHEGQWQMRWSQVAWIILTLMVLIATLVR